MQADQILKIVEDALNEMKAQNVVTIDVRSITDVADYMVIASGTSSRHVASLAEHAHLEAKKAGMPANSTEGADEAEWVLVDFGDVIVHVMQPTIREFYDLESLWSGLEAPAKGAYEPGED